MSKKRTSNESCINTAEEQTNNGAAPDVPQEEDNAKRAKLTPFMSDTTLQDLPIELIECILIKVVVMEVMSMKLARSVWKEKAELVINRLADVCWQWSNLLSTVVFRTRLDRTLEGQGRIHVDILQRYTIPFNFNDSLSTVASLRDEVFLHYRQHPQKDDYINVYDCNNMAELKHVIPIPGSNTERIIACTVSNCMYILNRQKRDHYSILSIKGDRWSTLSEVIADLNLPGCGFCVAADGRLILSRKQTIRIPAISVYTANGSLQQTIRLSADTNEKISEIITKPNGNLVLIGSSELPMLYDEDDDDDGGNDDGGVDDKDDDDVDDKDDDDDGDDDDEIDFDFFDDDNDWQAMLTEIDMNGDKISECMVCLGYLGCINNSIHSSIVDSDGRMMALSVKNGMQLYDSNFNPMDFTGDQLIGPKKSSSLFASVKFHFNGERNETIMIAFRLEEQ